MGELMKHYKVVRGDNAGGNDITTEVEYWIKEGWEPLGGIAVARIHASEFLYQAMTKDE